MAKNTISLLSQIHDKEINWNVCVLLSRLWHYRGTSDDGPILHTDLVVIGQEVHFIPCYVSLYSSLSCFLCCCLVLLIYVFPLQGTHMYAQLPPEASEHLKDVLEEGKVSLMKFMCNQLESSFRTVESPYMIQFTRYSTAVPQPGLEDAYPYCTYNLLPFPGIPRPTSNTPRFLG